MSAARWETVARACVFALLALQPVWHGWLDPPQRLPAWLVMGIAMLPLLLPAIGVLRRRPGALFLAGLVSLLYFSHGVAEAWADPAARIPALVEVALSLLLVGSIGAAGLQRRRALRNTP
jgi:uncharacterized membrane protein